jgi:outer membrane receptor protein involved in Fe transport
MMMMRRSSDGRSRRSWMSMALAMSMCGTFPVSGQRSVVADAVPSTGNMAAGTLAKPVSVTLNGVPLRRAIDELAARAGITVAYATDVVARASRPVTLHAVRMPVGTAFSRILEGTSLQLRVLSNGHFSVIRDDREEHVAGDIVGRVIDAKTRQPIQRAAVTLDGATTGVMTNETGGYRIAPVAVGQHTVTIKRLGYTRLVRQITISEGATQTVDAALEPSVNALEQVVVTGTVVATELKAIPSAITVITAKDIEQRGITKIDQLFRGDVPGLFAQNAGATSGTAFFNEVMMFSRGATAISAMSAGTSPNGLATYTNPIKTYVDGVELADPRYLSQIDPRSIERIEILTGPQASTIYGSNALNGVMQIFTKRGATSRTQLSLSLLSGWIENNFSSARTPQHDYSAQLNGIEGKLSYNAGASWQYSGPWTPAKKAASTSAFGGTRMEIPTSLGGVTADISLRRVIMQSTQRGSPRQVDMTYRETGWYGYSQFQPTGLPVPVRRTANAQTLGLILGYSPTGWWTNEVGLGQDVTDTETRTATRGYASVSDTNLSLTQSHTDRRSVRYTTTVLMPVTSLARMTVTAGVDAWQNLTNSLSLTSSSLTGSLIGAVGVPRVSRQPGHNGGAFLQTQLGVSDQLFLTYGLRAEWNPNFGDEAQPNYAPRYGVAYTRGLGALTAKVRASYGRSTRPPIPNMTAKMLASHTDSPALDLAEYGDYVFRFANPDLAPEHQSGGEGGLELYFGTRGSLVVTRYNQVIENLIANTRIDSVRSLAPNPVSGSQNGVLDSQGYGYKFQYQVLNVGSIRNQGWELQGSVNTGPLTTRGTYSWTKSRVIGVTAAVRRLFPAVDYPEYQPGATFEFLPEHTWALGTTYAYGTTTVGLHVTGMGRFRTSSSRNVFDLRNLIGSIRLSQNRMRMDDNGYVFFNAGYALADLVASHAFTARAEGVLQVQNLGDSYANDVDANYATMGRQVKLGARLRL